METAVISIVPVLISVFSMYPVICLLMNTNQLANPLCSLMEAWQNTKKMNQ